MKMEVETYTVLGNVGQDGRVVGGPLASFASDQNLGALGNCVLDVLGYQFPDGT
jgi:hypothetical protein